jgi:autotransporter adhesin
VEEGADLATAIGFAAQAFEPRAVAIGSRSVADVANTVSIGRAGDERRIVNVAAGTNPTDAVNLAQVEAMLTAKESTVRLERSRNGGGQPPAWVPARGLEEVARGVHRAAEKSGAGSGRDDDALETSFVAGWAKVDAYGKVVRAKNVAAHARLGTGRHEIAFVGREMRACSYNVVLRKFVGVVLTDEGASEDSVIIETRTLDGNLADAAFDVTATC